MDRIRRLLRNPMAATARRGDARGVSAFVAISTLFVTLLAAIGGEWTSFATYYYYVRPETVPEPVATPPPGAVIFVAVSPQAAVAGGEEFAVPILLDAGSQPVHGAEVVLDFAPALLEVLSVERPASCPLSQDVPAPAIDNVNGRVHFGRGVEFSGFALTGDCTFGILHLRARGPSGVSPLHFVIHPEAFPLTKAAHNGVQLPIAVRHGAVEVVAGVLAFAPPVPQRASHAFDFGITPTIQVIDEGGLATEPVLVTLALESGHPAAAFTCDNATPAGLRAVQKSVTGSATLTHCQIDLPGAYVLTATAPDTRPISTQVQVGWAGDGRPDCRIDIVDYSVLVKSFGQHATVSGAPNMQFNPQADFDGSGVVDITDFSQLVTQFGTRCPALSAEHLTGNLVEVSGELYLAHQPVSFSVDGVPTAPQGTGVSANSSGQFTAVLDVAPGTHVIKATQRDGRVIGGAVVAVPQQ